MFLCIEVIGLFVAIVCTILVWREVRRQSESRMQMTLVAARENAGGQAHRTSEDFHDQVWLPLCELIAAHATRLNYDLSAAQRRRIWRSRSPLILEVMLRELESATSAEALAKAIAELPPGMERPDPTSWCDHGSQTRM